MSWSESFSDVTSSEVSGSSARCTPKNDATKNSPEQFAAALKAAAVLIESGSLGVGHFNLHLSGHENDGHVPLPGWSPDCISISLARTPVQSAQDKAANAGS